MRPTLAVSVALLLAGAAACLLLRRHEALTPQRPGSSAERETRPLSLTAHR
jgi:hypothetical protein